MSGKWTAAMDAELTRRRKEGQTFATIAVAMKLPKNAAIGRAKRIGLDPTEVVLGALLRDAAGKAQPAQDLRREARAGRAAATSTAKAFPFQDTRPVALDAVRRAAARALPPVRASELMSNLNLLIGSLNALWTDLATIGVKEMPRLVFDDFNDWLTAVEVLPGEMRPPIVKSEMLAGFRIEYAKKPVNETDRFVAQEIGA